jgi:hypothetical protein
VQTLTRCSLPSIVSLAEWIFGRNRRLVWRLEWLTLLPETGPLPHTSHRRAKFRTPLY